jgi:hypothetical protein
MTKQLYINDSEQYEKRESERRRDFIQRMEQKLQFKLQKSSE